jgi:hypothetical protein
MVFITTMTDGTNATAKPTFCARRMRNASEKRARARIVATPTSRQKRPGRHLASSSRRRGLASSSCGCGSLTANYSQGDRGRHNRNPKNEPEIVGAKHHQGNCSEWSDKSPDRIERLPEAKARASQVGRCKICDERIARGIAHALPDPINKPCCKHPAGRCGQREERFGKRC